MIFSVQCLYIIVFDVYLLIELFVDRIICFIIKLNYGYL